MNLTEHFTLEELCFSSTAERLSVDNTPAEDIVANLNVLARGLEQVRRTFRAERYHLQHGGMSITPASGRHSKRRKPGTLPRRTH